jgi:hypothetical protein
MRYAQIPKVLQPKRPSPSSCHTQSGEGAFEFKFLELKFLQCFEKNDSEQTILPDALRSPFPFPASRGLRTPSRRVGGTKASPEKTLTQLLY